MSYEIFERTGIWKKQGVGSLLKIDPYSDRFSFNPQATKCLRRADATHIKLGWDRERRKILLVACGKAEQHFRLTEGKNTASFSAPGFCKHAQIVLKVRILLEWQELGQFEGTLPNQAFVDPGANDATPSAQTNDPEASSVRDRGTGA